jgi:hypothetical protein
MERRNLLLGGGIVAAAIAAWGFRGAAVAAVDRSLNRFAPDPDAPVPDEAERTLHRGSSSPICTPTP